MPTDYETYQSPFTWRYGSQDMRRIWSEAYKRKLWRRLWVTLAEVEAEFGLVSNAQLADLRQHMSQVDLPRALEIEAEIYHDLMAEIKLYAEQAPLGGGILHLGATSADIEDNADVIRQRESIDLLMDSLRTLLLSFAEKVDAWADLPVMGFTHLQPAEPTTLGYRLAIYAQDLFQDWQDLVAMRKALQSKGFRGAVGTGASYAELIGVNDLDRFEQRLSENLDLRFFTVVTQVYPRKQDYQMLCLLAGVGASLNKFAFDLRFLQSAPVGELGEPFGKAQVGSSAMPFKRNPVNAEKIDSLARMLAQLPRVGWDNAAHSLLERTLDDSANRRSILPEAFLISDEILAVSRRIVDGLQVNEKAIKRNLATYAPFAAIERLLVSLVKAGADRQAIHECLRQHSLAAWAAVQAGQPNPLVDLVSRDQEITRFLPAEEVRRLMDVSQYLGDAPERAHRLANDVRLALK